MGNRHRRTLYGRFDSEKYYENNRARKVDCGPGRDCNLIKVIKVDLTRR